MANPFVHLELNTPDLAKAKAFYGALFGWQFQDNDMGPIGIYSTFKPDEGPGGGLMLCPAEIPAGSPTSASRTSTNPRIRHVRLAHHPHGSARNSQHWLDDHLPRPHRLHQRLLPTQIKQYVTES